MATRYIFITGGVVSSLGKGIAAASLGALLQAHGFSVRIRKLDGYLNVDPGTMSPYQHGEVFVTEDGTETDLDLGHYERFTGRDHGRHDSTTMGRIYAQIIEKERRGDYLGGTVQVVPHVIDEIKSFILNATEDMNFVIVEVGGTVGDIESLPFLEAIRQLVFDLGHDRVLFIHAALVPYIKASGELKTKAAQHSVRTLLSYGIQPDILLCRTDRGLDASIKAKLGLFCNVRPECVITAKDLSSIYEAPLYAHCEGLDRQVCRHFHIPYQEPDLSHWKTIQEKLHHPEKRVRIAIVGKYVHLADAYKSVHEALIHGGFDNSAALDIIYVDAEDIEKHDDVAHFFKGCQGILVPGGFGERGIEGKIRAIQHARTQHIPFLGICLGMQLSIIEAARHLAGLVSASSTEFGSTDTPVVGLLTEWASNISLDKDMTREKRSAEGGLGGTMRLGAYDARLREESHAQSIYEGAEVISERHRHRYEVNTHYKEALENAGVVFSGMSLDGKLPEIIERRDHPFFIASQFHPEFKSRPCSPHPLFKSFVKAALDYLSHENIQ